MNHKVLRNHPNVNEYIFVCHLKYIFSINHFFKALEYAKVQVQKRPQKLSSDKRNPPDPTEQYVNSLFPEANDDGSGLFIIFSSIL